MPEQMAVSEHQDEYRQLLAQTVQHDRDAIRAHYKLAQLFARYGESVTEIANAISRSVTWVSAHLQIAQSIPDMDDLERILENRDDVSSWTVLVDWVKAGGPGQENDDDPDAQEISRRRRQSQAGGLNLTVPAHVIKDLADRGCNAREVMANFWANVNVNLLISVAYPDRTSRVA